VGAPRRPQAVRARQSMVLRRRNFIIGFQEEVSGRFSVEKLRKRLL
jgi:hypothetical protein